MNEKVIEEFRTNKGVVGGYFEGMNLLLLTVKGAKTERLLTVPLAYTKEGEKYVIIASKGGADQHPHWYYNLIANPEAKIEVGEEEFDVQATEVTGEERERLYDQHAETYPSFKEYKEKTDRQIPVFLLEVISQ